jgi:hypothetical protein
LNQSIAGRQGKMAGSVSQGRTPQGGVRYTRKNQKWLLNKIDHLRF